jgi:hypothetical protein
MDLQLARQFRGFGPIAPFRRGAVIPIRIRGHVEVVDIQVLFAYLPNLREGYHGLNFDGTLDLFQIVYNAAIAQGARIQPKIWERTAKTLIRSLSNNCVREIRTTNLDLMNYLEQSFHGPQTPPFPVYHRFGQTYQVFSCIAFLAEKFDSSRLRKTLVHFFSRFGSKIAKYEGSEEALFDWSKEIYKSLHSQEDLLECFRQIVLYRPDFVRMVEVMAMQHGTPTSLAVYQSIAAIAGALRESDMAVIPRGRGYVRRGPSMARRMGPWPFAVRARRPGYSRTLSGTIFPRRAGGIPPRAMMRQERRVNQLENRLARVERGVGILAEQEVKREMSDVRDVDMYDEGISEWSDSEYDDDWSI